MSVITKHCSNILATTCAAVFALLVATSTLVRADMPMEMPAASATPNPQLLKAFLASGGGAENFRSTTFVDALSTVHAHEKQLLEKRFGPVTMRTFAMVLDYVVRNSVPHHVLVTGSALSHADLASGLYQAGSSERSGFSIERLFDVLFGHAAHMRAMGDVAQRYGVAGETAYHQVLSSLIEDTGKPGTATRSTMMPGMAHAMAIPSPTPKISSVPMVSTSPMPSTSETPMQTSAPMQMNGMHGSGSDMPTNANGVMSMYGNAKMHMDTSAMPVRQMPGVADLGVPMSREGSGTAWLPDSSTTFGHMNVSGDTMLMTHGAGFVRYSNTFTGRGTRTFNAPNWYMVMASHPLGPASQLGARIMLTSDFATVGGYGYPELFQTGESYHGQPLHDHQHPHDLFSEAALTYSTQISRSTSAFVYVGYPGEPALGPPTYMHRSIAYDMPDAPIGHHWEDSTHITFGVVTAGVTLKDLKFEASTFTGREPNEIRTNFDPVGLDSVSGRVSWNPTVNLATQVSSGYIKSPEALAPNRSQHRTTASVVYNKPLALGEFLTTSAVWGQNYESTGGRSNAYLIEADYHRHSDSIYSRAEFVQKSGSELVLGFTETLFPIGAYTVGYVHDLKITTGTVVGLGGQVTFNTRPASLVRFYGRQTPAGFELFARFRPTALR